MKSHKAKIICFQFTVLISFIFFTQAVSAEKAGKHVINLKDEKGNETNITIINPDPAIFTTDPNVIKTELFDLKGIRLTPDTKVFLYGVDQDSILDRPEAIDEEDEIYFIFTETESKDKSPGYEVLVTYGDSLPTERARVHGKMLKGVLPFSFLTEKSRREQEIEEPKKYTYVTLMRVEESLEGRGRRYAIFELFAPKRSESDKGDKKESLKKFAFPIHEIYYFNIRLGFIYSELKNPEYGVRDIFTPDTSQKQRVLVITSEGDTQFNPALSVVYYPKGNDLRLDPDRKKLLQRIHPVVGFPLRGRIFESLFAGIDYELSIGVDIIAGVRTGKVKKLISDMVPYEPGTTGYTILPQEFTNDDIPLKEKWDYSYFLGIVFDTAVFTRLFGFD